MKEEEKFILDATCGGRMIWFNKNQENTIYTDKRVFAEKLSNGQYLNVNPDRVMDFRELDFPDKRFKLVVFDPPHLKSLGENSWAAKKYGVLDKDNWRSDIKKGFDECWRVLEDYGVLIFKWSEADSSASRSVKLKEVLELFDERPLFGHTTSNKRNTFWMCFMKIPPKTKTPPENPKEIIEGESPTK